MKSSLLATVLFAACAGQTQTLPVDPVQLEGTGQTPFAGEANPNPAITVLVYNIAQAPQAVLTEAEHEAGRILGHAGLRAVWLDCLDRHAVDRLCHKAREPIDVVLRTLPDHIPNRFPDTLFGFTTDPVLVSVYYERAIRFAKSNGVEGPIILGCVIAHELGHLLLGSNTHSSSGMQPRGERRQVQHMMMGALLFTSEQSKLMRKAARNRTDLQARNLNEQRKVAPAPALQVEVYDYGRLKPATLHELVTRMQGILAGAGLSVHVEACASEVGESCKNPPGTARSLVIRVVTGTARKMRNVPRAPLGLSFADNEGGTFASVFLERIQDAAAEAGFSWVIVLAYAASHEVGHLLLGNQAHTPQGLMKAYWDRHDYLQMSQNRCHFSDEQVQELTKRYGSSGQVDPGTGAEF